MATVIIGAGFILWALYRLNPNRFPTWFGTAFAVLAGLGVLIGVVGAAFSDIFLPLWDRLKAPESVIKPRLREDAPIRRINYETLVSRLGRSGRIPWIDRKATSTRELRLHGRIAIAGWMKSGKTREAAELIRAALAEDLITVVYEPTSALDLIDRNLLTTAIVAEVDERERALFFIDELGLRPEEERLERLSICVQDIYRVRSDTYFLITIQRERLTPKFNFWLESHQFRTIELPSLTSGQRQELVRTSSAAFDVNVAEDAVQVLSSSTDGRPYSIVFALQQVAGLRLMNKGGVDASVLRHWLADHFDDSELRTLCFELEIDYDNLPGRNKREKARELVAYIERRAQTTDLVRLLQERRPKIRIDMVAPQSSDAPSRVHAVDVKELLAHSDEEAWAEQRRQIIAGAPVAGPLLEAITTFASAGVTLRQSSIHRYALYLLDSSHSSHKGQRELDEAAKRWGIFDIVAVQGIYTIPEPLVLPLLLPSDEARNKLINFINQYSPGRLVSFTLILLKPIDFLSRLKLPLRTVPSLGKLERWTLDFGFFLLRLFRKKPKVAETFSSPFRFMDSLWLRFKFTLLDILFSWSADRALLLSELGNKIRGANVFSSNMMLNRGNLLREKERFKEALYYLDRAVVLNPYNSTTYLKRSVTYRLMRQYEEALADINQALELDPDLLVVAHRSAIYREMGRYEEALVDINQALELDPDHPVVAHRGVIYREMGRYEEALVDINKALELLPHYFWATIERSVTYREMGRYEEALADINRVVELEPEDDRLLYYRAIIYQTLDRIENANSDLEIAITVAQKRYEKASDFWNNVFALALYRLAAGQEDQAEILYAQTLANNPPYHFVREAVNDLQDYLKLFPESDRAQFVHKTLQQHLDEMKNS